MDTEFLLDYYNSFPQLPAVCLQRLVRLTMSSVDTNQTG